MSEERSLDDIFGEQKIIEAKVNEIGNVSDESIPKVPPDDSFNVRKSEYERFTLLVEHCKQIINNLPSHGKQDYDEVNAILSSVDGDFHETSSPSDLSRQIAIVQCMKDGLIRKYSDAHSSHIMRERIKDLLFDAYSQISQQKSADKRKGEASLALNEFVISSAESESFYVYCKQLMENLESKHRTASRRLACMEIQLALGELATAGDPSKIPSIGKTMDELKDEIRKQDSAPGEVGWGEK